MNAIDTARRLAADAGQGNVSRGALNQRLAALVAEMEAEADRQQAITEAAYREGWQDKTYNPGHTPDACWQASDSKTIGVCNFYLKAPPVATPSAGGIDRDCGTVWCHCEGHRAKYAPADDDSPGCWICAGGACDFELVDTGQAGLVRE